MPVNAKNALRIRLSMQRKRVAFLAASALVEKEL